MKKLCLLRHAKSDRPVGVEDFERPLNARGRKDAPKIAEAMHVRGLVPDAMLVSPSRRTRETWELIAPVLRTAAEPQFIDRLYLATAKQILDLLRQLDPDVRSALVIGHNPGIEDLAARLASDAQSREGEAAREHLRHKYPTCALTVTDFPIDDWGDLALGTGAIAAFLTPASLD